MSRIGKKPIQIPEGVKIEINGSRIIINGPKGKLSLEIPSGLTVRLMDSMAVLELAGASSATHGRVRAELANIVRGVKDGWDKTLEVIGTGFRASTDGRQLTLSLGFSHLVVISAPDGVNFLVQANKVTVQGIDKQLVGAVAAKVRATRPPDSYKGKGVRYTGEVVRKKQGKAAKGAVTGSQ